MSNHTPNSTLLFASLGNGISVADTSRMENGDYKRIAHISQSREVRIYCKITDEQKQEIEGFATHENPRISTSQDTPVFTSTALPKTTLNNVALDKTEAIKKLARWKTSLMKQDSRALRVKFVAVIVECQLFEELCDGTLMSHARLNERDFDHCFEMHDSQELICDLVEHGLADPTGRFDALVDKSLGSDTWKNWFEVYRKMNTQGDFFSGANING